MTAPTVKLVQTTPPEREGDPPKVVRLGPFPSVAAARVAARTLAIAFARSHSRTAPAPTYQIEPG